MPADRLRALMRPGHKGALALVFLLVLAVLGVAGCGNNDPGKEADEGVPIQLWDLKINVSETRFLNPNQPDDKQYLAGQQLPPPTGQAYLGVFLTMHNTGDSPLRIPSVGQLSIADTTGADYQAIPSHSSFAAPLGSTLAGHSDIPVPDTAAANGPTQAALVLFLLPQGITENRPLKLEIAYAGESGEITLDI
jgi:hypothetical protein